MHLKTELKHSLACSLSILILSAPFFSSIKVCAQSATGSSQSTTSNPSNLDLSSVTASLNAKNKSPVNIQVGGAVENGKVSGGTALTILPGQLVTPAQYVAIFGAMSGNQTLLIDPSGSAAGGSFNLNSRYVQNLAGLLVPGGVAVNAIGYNQATPLNVSGNVNLLGSMYSLQTAPNIMSVLNMGNLNIGVGGLLSGYLPAGMNLPGLYSSAGMQLNVAGNVLNQGTITTPGALNIIAGGNIVNQTFNNVQAVMAAQNINLATGAGNILNSGLIQAMNSLNLNTLNPTVDLNITNTNGVLQALTALNPLSNVLDTGVINIREDGANLELASISVTGGRLDAEGGINLFGKNMEVHVDSINGPLSNTGSVAHVDVKSGNLTLGRQILSGDPTYYNNAGDITIADLTSVAGDLAIVASGDIITTGSTVITAGSGNSVFLGAGFNFSVAPTNKSASSFPADDPGDTTNTLTFDGSTVPGKSINTAGNDLAITTSGTGGNITLAATGSINLGAGTLDATGTGNVLIIQGTGFSHTGTISTTTGNVTINSAAPVIANGATVLDGTVSALPTAGTASTGVISASTITSTSGNIQLSAQGSINLSGALSTGTTGTISVVADTANVTGNNQLITLDTGSLTVDSKGGLIASLGDITSSGLINIGTSNGTTSSAKGVTVGDIDNSAGTANVNILSDSVGITMGLVNSKGAVKAKTLTSGNITLNGTVTGGSVELGVPGAAVITSASNIDITSLTGAVNLGLLQLGTNDLSINVNGAANLVGYTSNSSTVNITGASVDFTAPADATAGSTTDTTTITATTGDITSSNVVLRANTIDFTAKGTVGVVPTEANSVTATATDGSILIVNIGDVNFSGSAGDFLLFQTLNHPDTADGNLTLSGNVVGPNGVSLILFVNFGHAMLDTNGNQILATNSPITIGADRIALSGANPINAGTGTVTIFPEIADVPINIGTGTGDLDLSVADLNSITAGTLIIGTSVTFGGINISGPAINFTTGYNLQLLQGNSLDNKLFGSINGLNVPITMPATGGSILMETKLGSISTDKITNNSTTAPSVILRTSGGNINLGGTNGANLPIGNDIRLLAGASPAPGVKTGAILGLGTLPLTITPGKNGNDGGVVQLRANNLLTSTGPSKITIDVSALGLSGKGGFASVERTATSALTVNSSNIVLNISGGTITGDQGTAVISNNGNLTIDPSSSILTSTATSTDSKGATIFLAGGTIGAGKLLVQTALSADGKGTGNGGIITLSSRSTTAFAIGSTTATNGSKASLSVNKGGGSLVDGDISIFNNGGGITNSINTLTNATNIVFDTSASSSGVITVGSAVGGVNTTNLTLSSGGSGAINATAPLFAKNLTLTSENGAITATDIVTQNLSANNATTGSGKITLTSIAGTPLTLLASSANKGVFSLTHGGDILTTGVVSGSSVNLTSTGVADSLISLGANVVANSSGTVTLTTSGPDGILDNGLGTTSIQGKTVILNSVNPIGAVGLGPAGALSINSSNVGFNSTGTVNVKNLGTTGLTLTSAATNGTFALRSVGPLTVKSAIANPTDIVLSTSAATSGITLTGAVGNTTNTKSIVVTTAGGNITGSGVLSGDPAGTVTLTSGTAGSIGTSTVPIKVNAPFVTTNTTSGLINLSNLRTAGVTVGNLQTTGVVKYASTGPSTFGTNVQGSTVTLKLVDANLFTGSILATGALSLTQTGAGQLTDIATALSSGTTMTLTLAGPLNVGNTTSAVGNIVIKTGGSTTFSGDLTSTAGTVTLTQTASGPSNFNGITGTTVTLNLKPTTGNDAIFNGDLTSTTGGVKITETLATGIVPGTTIFNNGADILAKTTVNASTIGTTLFQAVTSGNNSGNGSTILTTKGNLSIMGAVSGNGSTGTVTINQTAAGSSDFKAISGTSVTLNLKPTVGNNVIFNDDLTATTAGVRITETLQSGINPGTTTFIAGADILAKTTVNASTIGTTQFQAVTSGNNSGSGSTILSTKGNLTIAGAVSGNGAAGTVTINQTAAGASSFNAITGTSVTLNLKPTTLNDAVFNGDLTSTTGAVRITETGSVPGTTTFNAGADILAATSVTVTTIGDTTFSLTSNINSGNGGKSGNTVVTTKGNTNFLGLVNANAPTSTVSLTQNGGTTALFVEGGTAAGASYTVSNSGTFGISTGTTGITADTTVTLKNTGSTTNAGVTLDGNVTVSTTNGTVNLTGTGSGDLAQTGGTVTGKTVNFTSGTGDIGAVGNGFDLSASSVAAKSKGLANINNLNAGAMTLTSANTEGSFELVTAGSATITPSLTKATSINITTTGALTLKGATLGSTTSTTGPINLTTTTGNITGSSTLSTAGAVTLTSTSGGNFGTSTAALRMNAPTLVSANTTGTVNLSNLNNAPAGTTYGAITGSSVNITTANKSDFNGDIITNTTGSGNIKIVQTTGLLTIGSLTHLHAQGSTAQITLQEKANTAGSGILLKNDSFLESDVNLGLKPGGPTTFPRLGQISVVIGSSIPAPTNNTAPIGITVNPPLSNSVFFGTNASNISAIASDFTIVGNTAIQLQAGTTGTITLQNNADIHADPPIDPTAALAVHNAQLGAPLQNNSAQSALIDAASTFSSFKAPTYVARTAESNVITSSMPKVLQGGVTEFDASGSRCRRDGGAPGLESGDSVGSYGFLKESVEGGSESDINVVSDRDLGLGSNGTQMIGRGAQCATGTEGRKFVSLENGNAVFAPFADTTVETPFGKVNIDARSIALIFTSPNGTAVFNLDDQHKDAVTVRAGKHELQVHPGRHLMLTRLGKNFENINAAEAIAYRNIEEFEVGGGLRAITAEFSIPSAIAAFKPLKQLFNSKNPEALKLTGHLRKTIAAMLHMNRSAERYQQVMRSRMAAFSD